MVNRKVRLLAKRKGSGGDKIEWAGDERRGREALPRNDPNGGA